MVNILITGAKGQLGSEIKEISANYNFNFDFTDVEELDITEINKLNAYIKNKSFHYIINCAAYTAVDKAETEPEKANLINKTAVKNLVDVCLNNKIRLIHISTDYVFDGKNYKPYKENDPVSPQSVYGKTKLAGENAIIGSSIEYMILRTSWLYSRFGHNFVKTMLRLGKERDNISVVADQVGSPTNAADLAKAILNIIKAVDTELNDFKTGVYHYSNYGACSWYDFAKFIHKLGGIKCNIKPVSSEEYQVPAKRPYYSVLDKSKIVNTYNIEIPFWFESLENYFVLNKH
ncbi:MAG: dTDP-4-dehydrorhamnose reductase [Marinilabiliales bacterium]